MEKLAWQALLSFTEFSDCSVLLSFKLYVQDGVENFEKFVDVKMFLFLKEQVYMKVD